MPPSLLDSQFATLEDPAGEDHAAAVGVDAPLMEVVGRAAEAVREQRAAAGARR